MAEQNRVSPPFVNRAATLAPRQAARPTARAWVRHFALLLLTALTTTFAGVTLALDWTEELEPQLAEPSRWLDYLTYVPAYYALAVGSLARHALAHPELIAQGLVFAAALLAILLAHEAGHYLACRRYGVAATLPFFLPAPPLLGLGTFGAFIKIKSPIPTRRALFDIGVAGPLAGFAALIPAAVAAVLTARPASPETLEAAAQAGAVITFHDPPLLRLLAQASGVSLDYIAFNPFYFAAWIGLLVTGLNLLPVGQLDGGHAVYALFGGRAHRAVGRLAFAAMSAVAVLGWLWHGTPGGIIYALLLFVMLRVRHPQAGDEFETLGRARSLVALVTLVVFLLSFQPFPVSVG